MTGGATGLRIAAVALGVALAGCSASTGRSVAPAAATSPTDTTRAALAPIAGSANPFRVGRPLVIPHAGGDGMFPENTIYAYEQSVALGGDVIDVDVQLAGDGVPMALHDSTLERTTNGAGAARDLTAVEIGRLDAGWGFTRNGTFPFRDRGITVPTVEEVLAQFPTMLATLDLKDQHLDVVEPVCELITRLDRVDTVYVGIDTDEQVLRFREVCPAVRTSGTSDERRRARAAREANDLTFTTHQLVSQPPFVGDDGVRRVTAQTLAFAHRNDTAVLTYVVDDPDDMSELIDLGVDGIYTRYPDRLVALLDERGLR